MLERAMAINSYLLTFTGPERNSRHLHHLRHLRCAFAHDLPDRRAANFSGLLWLGVAQGLEYRTRNAGSQPKELTIFRASRFGGHSFSRIFP